MSIRVVAAIIELNGRLLICQRRVGGPFALKWEFPGGKMRPSETPRAALARELREELGIEVRIGRLLSRVVHRYSELADSVELAFFAATLAGLAANNDAQVRNGLGNSQVQPPHLRNLVFEQIRWVRPSDLERFDFLEADRQLVKRLVRGHM